MGPLNLLVSQDAAVGTAQASTKRRTMKKVDSLILWLAAVLFTFTANLTSAETGHLKFNIGVLLPLSGPLAEYGTAAKNGIDLAIKENPELFRNMQFLYDDSRYDGNSSISAFRKLQNNGDLSLLFVWGTTPSQVLAPIAEEAKIPMVALSTEPTLGARRHYVIRFCSHEGQQAEAILRYLRSQGVKRIGILKTDIAFFSGVVTELKQRRRADETLFVHDISLAESDFRTLLTRMRNERVDGIGVLLVSGQISSFYRQLKQLGMNTTTVGTDFFDSMTETTQAGGAMAGAVFPAHYVKSSFLKHYTEAYGNDTQFAVAAMTHDFALRTGALFANSQSDLNAQKIIEIFKKAEKQEGTVTDFSWNDSPTRPGFDFRLIMRRIDEDRIIDIGPR